MICSSWFRTDFVFSVSNASVAIDRRVSDTDSGINRRAPISRLAFFLSDKTLEPSVRCLQCRIWPILSQQADELVCLRHRATPKEPMLRVAPDR